jgi:hypothetical protein
MRHQLVAVDHLSLLDPASQATKKATLGSPFSLEDVLASGLLY